MLRQFCQHYLLNFHIFYNLVLYFLYSFTLRSKTHGKRVAFSFHLLAFYMLYELLSVLSSSRVKKKSNPHTFFTHLDMYGSLTFCSIPMKSVGFRQSTRTSASFSPFFSDNIAVEIYGISLSQHHTLPVFLPPKSLPSRGDSPRGGEMSRRDRGDRQQAVVGFPQHILKKRFTNSPKYDILYKNLSSQAYTSVFSANFAAYCVKNTCRATARLRIFALSATKLCSKIHIHFL